MYLERINNVFSGKLFIKKIWYFQDMQFLNLILSFVTMLWLFIIIHMVIHKYLDKRSCQ